MKKIKIYVGGLRSTENNQENDPWVSPHAKGSNNDMDLTAISPSHQDMTKIVYLTRK